MTKNQMIEHGSQNMEAHVTAVATKAMAGGSITATTGWALSNETVALGGFLLAFAGFVVNLIFQVRRDRRERELQAAKLKELETKQQEIILYHDED